MQGLSATAPAGVTGGIGDAYVASLKVLIGGDGTSRTIEMDGTSFEELMTLLEMRAQAFEAGVRVFRPHRAKALTVVQRLDRLGPRIAETGRTNPKLVDAADRLRGIAELSDMVTWSLA